MVRELTDKGIKEMEEERLPDEVIEVSPKQDTPKPIKPLPQAPRESSPIQIPPERKEQARKEFNNDPVTRRFGFFAVKKSTYIGLWIFAIISLFIIAIGVFWFTSSFSNKDLTPTINIENALAPNITLPQEIDNNITTNNNFSISFNIDDELSKKIADEVIERIKNETNLTA